jgi:hypothetical protein
MSARMRWLVRRAVAGFALLTFAGLVIAGTLVIKHAQDMESLLKAISSRCAGSRDASGFGAVAITGDLTLDGVSGSIPTPCRLFGMRICAPRHCSSVMGLCCIQRGQVARIRTLGRTKPAWVPR